MKIYTFGQGLAHAPANWTWPRDRRWVSRHVIFGRSVFLLGWMGHPVPEPDLSDGRGIGRRIVSTSCTISSEIGGKAPSLIMMKAR